MTTPAGAPKDRLGAGRSSGSGSALSELGPRGRALAASLGAALKDAPYVVRWLVLGAIVGASAGLVVVAFVRTIGVADQHLLAPLAGYHAPSTYANGGQPGSLHLVRPWALPLVVGLGGLLGGVIGLVVPEVRGSGTDEALRAVHENPRALRLRSIPAKILASACTIGSGGSGGPEGPSAQVAAAVGSWLTRLLDLAQTDGRVAVAIGLGSGIGCVFRAPLGGALLSAEILYRQDAEMELVVPSAIASIVGYTVFGAFQGFGPLLGFPGQSYVFRHPLNLLWFAVIGVLAAALGTAYIASLSLVRRLAARLGPSRVARVLGPTLGAAATGALAVGMPGVLGAGDGWAQRALGIGVLALPLWFVLLMPLAKVAATALTVGSGGSGGLFSPGMVIGAFTGAATWRLLRHLAPGLAHDPAPFVIVGMMCCLGAAARVPLAITVMVAEMTSSVGVVAPALLAVGLATLLIRQLDLSLIDAQLGSRDDLPARRLATALPLLETQRVDDCLQPPSLVLPGSTTATQARAALADQHLPGAPVVDEQGRFVGVLDLAQLEEAEPETPVGRLCDRQAVTTAPETRAALAAASLVNAGRGWLPVLDRHRRVQGILTAGDLVRASRHVVLQSLRRAASAGPAAATLDAEIHPHSPLCDRRLADAGLPPGVVLVAVSRGPEVVVPDGQTVLRAGDLVSLLVPQAARQQVQALLDPPEPEEPAGPSEDGRGPGPEPAASAEGASAPGPCHGNGRPGG
ncbi:chloride channel protein [Aciditerrimonas ferrireducens]|uniref:chloride channel protein n=1 Tax=Aciditerrimonas ferrireducens TaxID=667306 RepID=UPI00289EDB19|nr:chloride channel protein [Aciditerrimonas ferrireducens]